MVLRERVERAESKLSALKHEYGNNFGLKKVVSTLYIQSINNKLTAVFRRRTRKNPIDKVIGVLDVSLTLEEAVLTSMKFENDLEKTGSIDERLIEIADQKSAIKIFDDLAFDYFYNDDVDESKIGSSEYQNLNRYLGLYHEHIKDVIGDIPVKLIDGCHLDLVFEAITAKANETFTYTATKVHAKTLIKKLLDRGIRYKLTDFNAADYFSARELGYKDESGRKALLVSEVQELVRLLEKRPDKDRVNVICIYLLLLFGVRILDLVRAKAKDFRIELIPAKDGQSYTKEPIWLLNTGKVNVFRSMYITPFAKSLLDELAELQLKTGSEYLLPARKSNSKLPHVSKSTINKFLERVTALDEKKESSADLKSTEIKQEQTQLELMVHELRYTTRSLLSVFGIKDDVAESYISHSAKRYQKNFHHLFHDRKKGAQKLSNLIEHFINNPESENDA